MDAGYCEEARVVSLVGVVGMDSGVWRYCGMDKVLIVAYYGSA